MKFFACILLTCTIFAGNAPRHIVERTALGELDGKLVFADKYSDGTIDRSEVPKFVQLQNVQYSVASNISRVVCINTFRTNIFWCSVYEVHGLDGSTKTNLNFAPVDRKQLQIERKEAITRMRPNRIAAASGKKLSGASVSSSTFVSPQDIAKVEKLARAERASKNKASVSAQLTSELKRLNIQRVRHMEPAGEVISASVNAKGELVQRLTNGAVRVSAIPRRAGVLIAPPKKTEQKPVGDQTSHNVDATAAGVAGLAAGAAATAAALRKKK